MPRYSCGSSGSTRTCWYQVQTSTQPSRRSRSAVSAVPAKFHGPGQPRQRRRERLALAHAARPPPSAPRRCRRRRTGRRAGRRARSTSSSRANSRSWSAIQWKVAVERIASTGRSSSSSSRSATRSSTRVAEPLARRLDHRRRAVDGHHLAARQPLDQRRGHPAGAAAGVEHPLVAAQVEPVEHLPPHRLQRRRHPLVGRRVPVARRHTTVRYRGQRAGGSVSVASRPSTSRSASSPAASTSAATSAAGWRHLPST